MTASFFAPPHVILDNAETAAAFFYFGYLCCREHVFSRGFWGIKKKEKSR